MFVHCFQFNLWHALNDSGSSQNTFDVFIINVIFTLGGGEVGGRGVRMQCEFLHGNETFLTDKYPCKISFNLSMFMFKNLFLFSPFQICLVFRHYAMKISNLKTKLYVNYAWKKQFLWCFYHVDTCVHAQIVLQHLETVQYVVPLLKALWRHFWHKWKDI